MDFYTDLACEKGTGRFDKIADDLDYGCEEIYIDINTLAKCNEYRKPKGKYYLLNCPNLSVLAPIVADYIAKQLADYLKSYIKSGVSKKPMRVMVFGLGNNGLVCDSLGTLTTKKLIIQSYEKSENGNEIITFCPGVSARTGIPTSSLVKSMVINNKPNLVILIDSLCAVSASRLGNSFQISDSGIVAGGAFGTTDEMINSKFLGVPTLVIGTPLVIRCETIIGEVLGKISDVDFDIDNNIYSIGNLIVTPKDIDKLVSMNASIIASAINLAVLDIGLEDQKLINY